MRLFIAIDIDEDTRARLADARQRLRYVNAKISWVASSNYHFTLKFLGETEEAMVEPVERAMSEVAAGFGPISCELRGLGQFPRVIWAGIHGETDRLSTLANRLDTALAPLGFSPETRAFRAHLTLGRIKSVADKERLTTLIASRKDERFGDVRIEDVHLYQSQLTPHGSIYTKLFTVSLKGANHGHQTGKT